MKNHLLLFIFFLFSFSAVAEIDIHPYRKKYSWKPEWTSLLKEELNKDQMKDQFLSIEIHPDDLNALSCPGYNRAGLEEKKDFWVTFFASLTRAESGFNEKAMSPKTKGHRSFGLLQLARLTAKNVCGTGSVLNASENLKCGLKLMWWQLQGAPKNGRKLRSDLEGHLFGKGIFQWGPLRERDHRGRKLLVNWFNSHLDQLKFCKNEENWPTKVGQ